MKIIDYKILKSITIREGFCKKTIRYIEVSISKFFKLEKHIIVATTEDFNDIYSTKSADVSSFNTVYNYLETGKKLEYNIEFKLNNMIIENELSDRMKKLYENN